MNVRFHQCRIFDGQLHGFEGTVPIVLFFEDGCWTSTGVDTGKKATKTGYPRSAAEAVDDCGVPVTPIDAGGLTPHHNATPVFGILDIPPNVLAVASNNSGLLPFH
jgi:hypothetical protein